MDIVEAAMGTVYRTYKETKLTAITAIGTRFKAPNTFTEAFKGQLDTLVRLEYQRATYYFVDEAQKVEKAIQQNWKNKIGANIETLMVTIKPNFKLGCQTLLNAANNILEAFETGMKQYRISTQQEDMEIAAAGAKQTITDLLQLVSNEIRGTLNPIAETYQRAIEAVITDSKSYTLVHGNHETIEGAFTAFKDRITKALDAFVEEAKKMTNPPSTSQ